MNLKISCPAFAICIATAMLALPELVVAEPKPGQPAVVQTAKPEYDSKLDSIILVRTNFQGATLEEALAFVRAKAVELDPTPSKSGINILLKTVSPTKTITLDLRDTSLRVFLSIIADLAGASLKFEPNAVVFYSNGPDLKQLEAKLKQLDAELAKAKDMKDADGEGALRDVRKKLLLEIYSAKFLSEKSK